MLAFVPVSERHEPRAACIVGTHVEGTDTRAQRVSREESRARGGEVRARGLRPRWCRRRDGTRTRVTCLRARTSTGADRQLEESGVRAVVEGGVWAGRQAGGVEGEI